MKDIYQLYGIYRITNVTNGMSYIGKTGMNFGDRWDNHRSLLRTGKHDNPYLQNAWNKYGEDNFEFAILQVVNDVSDLNDLERMYIAEYRSRSLSYNLHDGGDGGYNLGKHLSEETKRKIGEKNRANMTGRKFSNDTRAKMSASQQSRYEHWTEEQRLEYGRKMSERSRGYHWSEQARAAFAHKQRTKPNGAKFTADDIHAIRSSAENGVSYVELAKIYNTTPAYIASIVARRRWAFI